MTHAFVGSMAFHIIIARHIARTIRKLGCTWLIASSVSGIVRMSATSCLSVRRYISPSATDAAGDVRLTSNVGRTGFPLSITRGSPWMRIRRRFSTARSAGIDVPLPNKTMPQAIAADSVYASR